MMQSWFGTKTPVKVYSGYMGDLSQEQAEVLHQLREWVRFQKLDPLCQFDDFDLLRFCRARQFKLDQVQTMFANFIKQRHEHDVDNILDYYHYPELLEVRKYFPHSYHGVDLEGRPVIIERMGIADVPKLLQATNSARLMQYMRFFREHQMKVRMPICGALAGKQVEKVLTIQDLTGASLSLVSSQGLGLFREVGSMCADQYPETMGPYIIVNPPSVFGIGFAMMKGFLDEKTKQNFIVTNQSNQLEILLQHIDRSQLPKIYGGDCECPGEGGCYDSDIGPWTEYERMSQRGKLRGQFRRQQEKEKVWENDLPLVTEESEFDSPNRRLANRSDKLVIKKYFSSPI